MDLVRRAATADDHALARRIHHLAYRDVVERQFGHWDEAAQDAYFDRAWHEHAHDILYLGRSTCGYAAIDVGGDSVDVHELVILPACQGHGIGTHVLLETVAEADRLELPVRLQVLLENDGARRLYERLGFFEIGTTTTHRLMERTSAT